MTEPDSIEPLNAFSVEQINSLVLLPMTQAADADQTIVEPIRKKEKRKSRSTSPAASKSPRKKQSFETHAVDSKNSSESAPRQLFILPGKTEVTQSNMQQYLSQPGSSQPISSVDDESNQRLLDFQQYSMSTTPLTTLTSNGSEAESFMQGLVTLQMDEKNAGNLINSAWDVNSPLVTCQTPDQSTLGQSSTQNHITINDLITSSSQLSSSQNFDSSSLSSGLFTSSVEEVQPPRPMYSKVSDMLAPLQSTQPQQLSIVAQIEASQQNVANKSLKKQTSDSQAELTLTNTGDPDPDISQQLMVSASSSNAAPATSATPFQSSNVASVAMRSLSQIVQMKANRSPNAATTVSAAGQFSPGLTLQSGQVVSPSISGQIPNITQLTNHIIALAAQHNQNPASNSTVVNANIVNSSQANMQPVLQLAQGNNILNQVIPIQKNVQSKAQTQILPSINTLQQADSATTPVVQGNLVQDTQSQVLTSQGQAISNQQVMTSSSAAQQPQQLQIAYARNNVSQVPLQPPPYTNVVLQQQASIVQQQSALATPQPPSQLVEQHSQMVSQLSQPALIPQQPSSQAQPGLPQITTQLTSQTTLTSQQLQQLTAMQQQQLTNQQQLTPTDNATQPITQLVQVNVQQLPSFANIAQQLPTKPGQTGKVLPLTGQTSATGQTVQLLQPATTIPDLGTQQVLGQASKVEPLNVSYGLQSTMQTNQMEAPPYYQQNAAQSVPLVQQQQTTQIGEQQQMLQQGIPSLNPQPQSATEAVQQLRLPMADDSREILKAKLKLTINEKKAGGQDPLMSLDQQIKGLLQLHQYLNMQGHQSESDGIIKAVLLGLIRSHDPEMKKEIAYPKGKDPMKRVSSIYQATGEKLQMTEFDCPETYCVFCNARYARKCPVHTQSGVHVVDPDVFCWSRLTLPPGVILCAATTQKAQAYYGEAKFIVVSTQPRPKGTRFGPLVGVLSKLEESEVPVSCMWKLFQEGPTPECKYVLEVLDEDSCNWMMYIRRATSTAEQNLVATQENGSIFFFASRDIGIHEELCYWYSTDYGSKFGMPVTPTNWVICSECHKTFIDVESLKSHKAIFHCNQKGKNLECEHCKKRFRSPYKLSIHMNSHTGERPFICKQCSKAFGDPNNLQKHIKSVHTEERNFKCDQCDRTFRQKSHLKGHYVVHTGERYLSCQFCSKKFSRPSDLNTHLKLHTKQSPDSNEVVFTCEVEECGKSFTKKASLTKHMKIHEGAKDHQCAGCDKFFSSAYHVRRHSKICKGSSFMKVIPNPPSNKSEPMDQVSSTVASNGLPYPDSNQNMLSPESQMDLQTSSPILLSSAALSSVNSQLPTSSMIYTMPSVNQAEAIGIDSSMHQATVTDVSVLMSASSGHDQSQTALQHSQQLDMNTAAAMNDQPSEIFF